MAGIDRMGQDVGHALLFELTVFQMRELREALKMACHLSLRLEVAGRKALKRFFHDRVEGWIGYQHAPTAALLLIAIANRGVVDPEAAFHARLHLLGYLSSVLFTLQLTLGRNDGLDELTFRAVLFKLEVQTLDNCVALPQSFSQFQVEARGSGEAFRVIEDHKELLIRLAIQECQKRHHPWALRVVDAATDRIGEGRYDFEARGFRVVSTAFFLALQAVAVLLLIASAYSRIR